MEREIVVVDTFWREHARHYSTLRNVHYRKRRRDIEVVEMTLENIYLKSVEAVDCPLFKS